MVSKCDIAAEARCRRCRGDSTDRIAAVVAQMTLTETTVATVWERVLQLPPDSAALLGAESDFHGGLCAINAMRANAMN